VAVGAELDGEPERAASMASTSWLLRIRPVPVMPSPEAMVCNSDKTLPDKPDPEALRVRTDPAEARA
jgi:hypothetical protein